MAEVQAARFQGLVQFGMFLDGARMTPEGFDSDGDLVVDQPNEVDTVRAIQQALFDLGFPIGVDGDYGPNTVENAREFKIQHDIPLPPGATSHSGTTGKGTAQRLDEIFAAASAVVRFCNEYGEALPGVTLELSGSDGVRLATTDGDGAAVIDQGGPWAVTLEPTSTLAALGDLLGRPWPPDPPPPNSTWRPRTWRSRRCSPMSRWDCR